MKLCQQTYICAFEYAVKVCHSFPSKEQAFFFFFNFMASVTVLSDFGPKKTKSVTASTFPPSIWHEVTVLDGHDLCFFNIEFEASFR